MAVPGLHFSCSHISSDSDEFLPQCREAESLIVKAQLGGPKDETWWVERRKPNRLGPEVQGREDRGRAQ